MNSAVIACWNEIGVAGDQSCEKLAQHIHCRNCEVYAGAAQRSLRRPVDDDYRRHWAGELRAREHERVAQDSSALAFRIGREWLALPTAVVEAIAPLTASHRLPHRAAPGLLGIVNVSGKLTPAVSLAALLGIDEHDAPPVHGRHAFARLLVVAWQGQRFALPVADLHGIVRYAQAELALPASTINKGVLHYLRGVAVTGELHVGVLDAALLGPQLASLLR